jgi:hypothetical protein
MTPVESITKSLTRDRIVIALLTAACCFTAAGVGFATQLKFLNPAAKQLGAYFGQLAIIGISHGFLTMRLASAVKALSEASPPNKPD